MLIWYLESQGIRLERKATVIIVAISYHLLKTQYMQCIVLSILHALHQ